MEDCYPRSFRIFNMTPLAVLLAAVALCAGAPAEYGNEEPPTPVINIADNEYLIEAELFAKRKGWQDDPSRLPQRSTASNGYSVHLYKSESYTVDFCLPIEQSVWIENVYFSNDGWVDTVSVALNGREIGEFLSADESNWGNLWNEFNATGSIGGELGLPSGRNSLTFTVKDGDEWGVELDAIKMRFSRPDVTVDLFCPGEADNSDDKNNTGGQNYPELPNTATSFPSTDSPLTGTNQPTTASPHQTSYPANNYKTRNPRCRLPFCHHNYNTGHTQPTRSTGLPVNPNYPDDPYCLSLKCRQDAADSKNTYPPNSGNTKTSDPFSDGKSSPTEETRSDYTKPTDSSATKASTSQDGSEYPYPSGTSFSPNPSDSTSSRPSDHSGSRRPTDLPIVQTTRSPSSPNTDGKQSTDTYKPSDSTDNPQQSNLKTTTPSEEFITGSAKPFDSSATTTSNQKCSSPDCEENESTPTSPSFPSETPGSESNNPQYSTGPLCKLPGCHQSSTPAIETSTEPTNSVSVTPVNPEYPDDPYCQTPECKQNIKETSDPTVSGSTEPNSTGYPTCTGKDCEDNQTTNKYPSTPSLSKDTPGGTKSPDVTSTTPPSNSDCTSPDCQSSPSYSESSQPTPDKTKSSDATRVPESSTITNILSSGVTDPTQTADPWTTASTVPGVSTKTENEKPTKPTSTAVVDPECTTAECKQTTKTAVPSSSTPECTTAECKQNTQTMVPSSSAPIDHWFSTPATVENQDSTNTDTSTDSITAECDSPECKKSSPKPTSPSDTTTNSTDSTDVNSDCTSPGCYNTDKINPTTQKDPSKSTNPSISGSPNPTSKPGHPTDVNSDCTSPGCYNTDKINPTTQKDPSKSTNPSISGSPNPLDETTSSTPTITESTKNVDLDCTSPECKSKTSLGITDSTADPGVTGDTPALTESPQNTETSKTDSIDPWVSENTRVTTASPSYSQNTDNTETLKTDSTDSWVSGNKYDSTEGPTYSKNTDISGTANTNSPYPTTSQESKYTTSSDKTYPTDSSNGKSTTSTIGSECTSPECKQGSSTSSPYTNPKASTTDPANVPLDSSNNPTSTSASTSSGNRVSPSNGISTDSPLPDSTKPVKLVDPDCTSPECKQNLSQTTLWADTKSTGTSVTGVTDSTYPKSQQTEKWNSDSTASTNTPKFSSTKTIPDSTLSSDPDCTSPECQQNPASAKPIDTESTDSNPTVPTSTDPWYSTNTKTADSSNPDQSKSTENVVGGSKPTESSNPNGQNSGSPYDPDCTSQECQQNSSDKPSHGTKPYDNTTPSNSYDSTTPRSSDKTKEENCNTPDCRLPVTTESTTEEQGSSQSPDNNVSQQPDVPTGGNSPPLTDEVYQISCPTPQLLTVRRNDYLGCADDGKIRFDLYGARVSEVTFVIPTPFRIPKPSLRRLEARTQEKILWEDGYPRDSCDGSEQNTHRRKGISQPASDGSLPITINPSVTPSLTLSFRLSTTGVDLGKHLRPVFTMGVCCTDPTNISMTAVETDTNTVIKLGEQLFHGKDNLKSWIFPFISGLDDRNIKVKINFNDVTERLVLNYMKFEIQEVDQKAHDAPTAPPTTVLCETKDVKVEGVKHEDPNKKKLKFRFNGSSTTSDVSSLLFKSPLTSDPKLVLDPSGKCLFNPLSPVNVDDSAAFILGATDPNSSNPNLAIEEVELETDVNEVDNTSVILHLLGSTFGRTSLKLKISERETTLTLLQLVPYGKPLSSFFLPCGREQTTIKADETDAISINDPWKSITGEQLTIRRR